MSKILVIDDNKDSLISIREVLKVLDSSYQVITAQGGEEGFEKAKKESPDTILLDISMPYLDGFEVCKLLKTDDATKHVPVVMLTAIQTDIRSRIKAFKLGADAFLTKPIDQAELGAQINVMLRIKKAEDKLRLEKKSLEDLVEERTKGLRESEEKYKLIAENTSDVISLHTFDLKATYTYVSPSMKVISGYEPEELLGKSCFELMHPEDKNVLFPLLKKYVNSKMKNLLTGKESTVSETIEYRIKDKSGNWRYAQSTGNIVGNQLLFISRDITERKQAEKNLNKSLQQEKLLSEVSYLFTKLEDFEMNMNDAIRLIGEHTGVSRVYIFEDYNNGEYTKNTYEWCNKNIEPQVDNLREIPYTIIPSWKKILNEKGLVLSSNIFELPKDLINILEPQVIKSIFVLPIYIQNQFFGFMGFDECVKNRIWEKSKIELLKTIVNILSNSFERKQAETRRDAALKALRESEEKYRFLVESLEEGIGIVDEDENFVFVNQAVVKIFGYSKEELLKKNLKELTTPEEFQRILQQTSIRKAGESSKYDVKIIRKDGIHRIISSHISPVIEDRKYKGAFGIFRDITEQKRAEEALQESEEKYRQLAETAKDAIMMLDLKGNVKYINKEGLKLSGYSEDEALQMNVNDVLPADQLQSSYEKFEKRAAGESQIFMYEIEFINKKGKKIPVEVKSSLIEEQGKPSGVLIIARDITERKKAEKSLQDSELRYRTMINSMSDAIHLVDSDLRYTMTNPTLQRWAKGFGLGITDIIGKTIFEVFPSFSEKICEKVRKEYKQVFRTGKTLITEETITFRNTDFITETRKIPVFEKGKVTQVVTVIRDITERKQAEVELRKYSENQEVLIREVNHRVRNNLTAIISMIYTEEDLAKRKGMFDLLSVLRNLAIRILGLSTIHSMLSESEWRPLKIKQLCENVINATLKSINSLKEINITIVPSEVRVGSDQAHHLALVINELTTNSMKHAFENKEKGNISINIGEERENILLHFSDDGPGYPQEMLKGDFSKTSTGFEIIQGIVKQNLAGELKLNNENGAVTAIIFKKVLE